MASNAKTSNGIASLGDMVRQCHMITRGPDGVVQGYYGNGSLYRSGTFELRNNSACPYLLYISATTEVRAGAAQTVVQSTQISCALLIQTCFIIIV